MHISVGIDSQQSLYAQIRKDGAIITGALGQAQSGLGTQAQATWHQSYSTSTEAPIPVNMQYLDTAGSTSGRYYNVAVSHTSGLTRTMYLNRGASNSNDYNKGRSTSTITVMEIAA